MAEKHNGSPLLSGWGNPRGYRSPVFTGRGYVQRHSTTKELRAAADPAPTGAEVGGDAGVGELGRAYPDDFSSRRPCPAKAPARAFRYERMLDEGQYASITEMADAEKLDRGYMGRLLQLTLLAPDIVKAILDGQRPVEVTLPGLLTPFPVGWDQQTRV